MYCVIPSTRWIRGKLKECGRKANYQLYLIRPTPLSGSLRACLVSVEVPDFRAERRQIFADVPFVPQEKLPKYGAERRVKTVLRKILNRL